MRMCCGAEVFGTCSNCGGPGALIAEAVETEILGEMIGGPVGRALEEVAAVEAFEAVEGEIFGGGNFF